MAQPPNGTAKTALLGMGQITLVRGDEIARTVLGSCIGLSLYHERLRIGMLAHIVLPKSEGREAPPGKFADTAVPYMVDQLKQEGAGQSGLVAKMAGGASMFGNTGPVKIGADNARMVEDLLRELRIPLRGEDVGGSQGRRMTLECASGNCLVEIVGQTPTVM